ncbi:SchA/CurD-like domain-containing protein [Streptomyces sp. NPDC090022]|uniref:SchA/CurD-like domain-containing protein n=1 Tax=Streptomyces sp. NPDC090022 TaxID=3365920 RepID=UPI00380ACD63
MTTTLPDRVSQSAFDGSMLRVVFLVDLHEGTQQEFFDAYDRMRHEVASVPGHISDQLCQSFENPSQWLITSEWESAPHYFAWVNSDEHIEQVRPLSVCMRSNKALKYTVLRETGRPSAKQLQSAPRLGSGIVRHALTFTVKPGSEERVRELLAGYASPKARVDAHTRLARTTLFMHGNRVVRTVEIEGDLMAALRHVAMQPEVRAVEEAINPHLEQDRNLDDPESARVFFMKAALPAVHHIAARGADSAGVTRHALYYPAKPGCGTAVARFLARQDELAAQDPASPVRSSCLFQRDDVVVRLIDVSGPLEGVEPDLAFGIRGRRKAAVLARLLDVPAMEKASSLLDRQTMTLVTDRRAPAEH